MLMYPIVGIEDCHWSEHVWIIQMMMPNIGSLDPHGTVPVPYPLEAFSVRLGADYSHKLPL
jgi:hypothetical protein